MQLLPSEPRGRRFLLIGIGLTAALLVLARFNLAIDGFRTPLLGQVSGGQAVCSYLSTCQYIMPGSYCYGAVYTGSSAMDQCVAAGSKDPRPATVIPNGSWLNYIENCFATNPRDMDYCGGNSLYCVRGLSSEEAVYAQSHTFGWGESWVSGNNCDGRCSPEEFTFQPCNLDVSPYVNNNGTFTPNCANGICQQWNEGAAGACSTDIAARQCMRGTNGAIFFRQDGKSCTSDSQCYPGLAAAAGNYAGQLPTNASRCIQGVCTQNGAGGQSCSANNQNTIYGPMSPGETVQYPSSSLEYCQNTFVGCFMTITTANSATCNLTGNYCAGAPCVWQGNIATCGVACTNGSSSAMTSAPTSSSSSSQSSSTSSEGYCGDGVVQQELGEACDPANPAWTVLFPRGTTNEWDERNVCRNDCQLYSCVNSMDDDNDGYPGTKDQSCYSGQGDGAVPTEGWVWMEQGEDFIYFNPTEEITPDMEDGFYWDELYDWDEYGDYQANLNVTAPEGKRGFWDIVAFFFEPKNLTADISLNNDTEIYQCVRLGSGGNDQPLWRCINTPLCSTFASNIQDDLNDTTLDLVYCYDTVYKDCVQSCYANFSGKNERAECIQQGKVNAKGQFIPKCTANPGAATARKNPGESCEKDYQCQTGYCEVTNLDRQLGEEAPCGTNAGCLANEACVNFVCKKKLCANCENDNNCQVEMLMDVVQNWKCNKPNPIIPSKPLGYCENPDSELLPNFLNKTCSVCSDWYVSGAYRGPGINYGNYMEGAVDADGDLRGDDGFPQGLGCGNFCSNGGIGGGGAAAAVGVGVVDGSCVCFGEGNLRTGICVPVQGPDPNALGMPACQASCAQTCQAGGNGQDLQRPTGFQPGGGGGGTTGTTGGATGTTGGTGTTGTTTGGTGGGTTGATGGAAAGATGGATGATGTTGGATGTTGGTTGTTGGTTGTTGGATGATGGATGTTGGAGATGGEAGTTGGQPPLGSSQSSRSASSRSASSRSSQELICVEDSDVISGGNCPSDFVCMNFSRCLFIGGVNQSNGCPGISNPSATCCDTLSPFCEEQASSRSASSVSSRSSRAPVCVDRDDIEAGQCAAGFYCMDRLDCSGYGGQTNGAPCAGGGANTACCGVNLPLCTVASSQSSRSSGSSQSSRSTSSLSSASSRSSGSSQSSRSLSSASSQSSRSLSSVSSQSSRSFSSMSFSFFSQSSFSFASFASLSSDPASCTTNEQCPTLDCEGGLCQCDDPVDCNMGDCIQSVCRTECLEDVHCPTGICQSGACRPECEFDWQCGSGQCTLQRCAVPACGDGRLDAGEECDDGNARPLDGCTEKCLQERGQCGDGKVQRLFGEQCEPPNVGNCSVSCRFVLPFCGNGSLDLGEECDLGTANGNAPASLCRMDCSRPRCGDRTLQMNEACDDGNLVNGDGCSAQCLVERSAAVLPGSIIDLPFTQEPIPCDGDNQCESGLCNSVCVLCLSDNDCGTGRDCLAGRCLVPPVHAPVGDTGPAALIIIAGGAGAGIAWVRRRRRAV